MRYCFNCPKRERIRYEFLRQLCKLAKQKTVLLKQAKLKDSSKILRSKTRALIALYTITTIPMAISCRWGKGKRQRRQETKFAKRVVFSSPRAGEGRVRGIREARIFFIMM
jgi:hypothetical protein